MPDLPDVEQKFTADAAEYLAAVDSMIAALDRLVGKTADVRNAMVEMATVAAASAATIDAAMSRAAAATEEVGNAARGTAGSSAELAAILRMLTFATDSAEASEMHLSEVTQTLGIIQKNTADSALSLMLVEQLLGQILERTGAAARGAAGNLLLLGAAGSAAAAGAGRAGAAAAGATGWWARWGNVVHWVVMGTLEIAATAVPAIVAFGAAVAGMYQTFGHITDVMSALYTASGSLRGALQNSVGPLQALGVAGSKVEQFLKPDAYIIFGSVIEGLSGHVGAFSTVAEQAGNVLAQFASKISAELSGPMGTTLSNFFADAVKYMIQWGQVLGNLGHTFINIVGGMHGVGQILLDVLVAISRAFEMITAVPFVAWIIGALAAMSALYRYSLLMKSAFNWLGGSALASGFKSLAAVVTDVGYAFMAAGGGVAGFRDAMATLWADTGPLLVVLAAVAAALLLWKYVAMGAQDPTDNLIASLNKMTPTVSNLNQGIQVMSAHIISLYPNIDAATARFDKLATTASRVSAGVRAAGQAVSNMTINDIDKSIAEITKLTTQAIDLAAGLAETGMRAGAVGAAMNAMAIQTAIADSKIQAVNQALDQYIQILTGATSGNANFITSLANIGSIAATTANNLGTASSISLNAKQFSQALSNWGTTGAAAWQNFDQVVNGSIQPLMDNLRLMGVTGALTGKQVQQAMVDMVVSTAKWAGGNPYAQSVLMSLLNTVGLAPSNFSKFVASQQKAGAGQKQLNGIVDQGTLAFSKLSAMAKNAANAINPLVTNAIATSALKASGYNAAIAQLNKDIGNHAPRAVIIADLNKIGTTSYAAQQIAASYGNTVSTSQGQAASATHSSSGKIQTDMGLTKAKALEVLTQFQKTGSGSSAAVASAAGGIHGSLAKTDGDFNAAIIKVHDFQTALNSLHAPPPIVVTTIYRTVGSPVGAGIPGISNAPVKAAGGEIHGPGSSTSDSIPAWLSDGEFVMRSAAVKHYGLGFMHALNAGRFAGGGVPHMIGPHNSPHGGGFGGGGGLGGGPPVHLHSNIVVELDGKQLSSIFRTDILTYVRRNIGNNLTLLHR